MSNNDMAGRDIVSDNGVDVMDGVDGMKYINTMEGMLIRYGVCVVDISRYMARGIVGISEMIRGYVEGRGYKLVIRRKEKEVGNVVEEYIGDISGGNIDIILKHISDISIRHGIEVYIGVNSYVREVEVYIGREAYYEYDMRSGVSIKGKGLISNDVCGEIYRRYIRGYKNISNYDYSGVIEYWERGDAEMNITCINNIATRNYYNDRHNDGFGGMYIFLEDKVIDGYKVVEFDIGNIYELRACYTEVGNYYIGELPIGEHENPPRRVRYDFKIHNIDTINVGEVNEEHHGRDYIGNCKIKNMLNIDMNSYYHEIINKRMIQIPREYYESFVQCYGI